MLFISLFYINRRKNMGNMYVQVAIEINRKQTAERACCNSQKKLFLSCLSAKT